MDPVSCDPSAMTLGPPIVSCQTCQTLTGSLPRSANKPWRAPSTNRTSVGSSIAQERTRCEAGITPGSALAVAVRFGRTQQGAPGRDDADVGRHQMLLGAVLNRPHALLQGCVLHADAVDAAIGRAGGLGLAVHQVV